MILGGRTTEDVDPALNLQAAEVYDPATRQFSLFGSTALARGLHALAPLNNGKYLMVGGYHLNDTPTATTEIFDAAVHTSAAGPEMSDWRIRAAAVRPKSGEVLVIGGNNSGGPVKPVDLFE